MMTRLQFLRSLGALGLAAVTLPACKKDDDDPTPDAGNQQNPDANSATMDAPPGDAPAPQNCASTGATIANNHGHAITVTAAGTITIYPNSDLVTNWNTFGSSGFPSYEVTWMTS